MNLTDNIKALFQKKGRALSEEIKSELKEQGHLHTGKLFNSIKANATTEGKEVALNVDMLDYFEFVNRGVKASRIPYGGKRTGKKRSKYIEALINYFKQKGKSIQEAKAAAFATARKHSDPKGPGMPTKNSYSKEFSANGRRLRFIEESTDVSKSIDELDTQIQDEIEKQYNLIFDKFEKAVR